MLSTSRYSGHSGCGCAMQLYNNARTERPCYFLVETLLLVLVLYYNILCTTTTFTSLYNLKTPVCIGHLVQFSVPKLAKANQLKKNPTKFTGSIVNCEGRTMKYMASSIGRVGQYLYYCLLATIQSASPDFWLCCAKHIRLVPMCEKNKPNSTTRPVIVIFVFGMVFLCTQIYHYI